MGEDDQRQHGAAAQQAHKVVGGEEVHDHVGEGGVLADGLGGHVGPGLQHRGNQLHDNEHDDGGNGAGDHEGEHGGAHDLACPFRLRTLATELEMEANTSGTTTQNIILMNTVPAGLIK